MCVSLQLNRIYRQRQAEGNQNDENSIIALSSQFSFHSIWSWLPLFSEAYLIIHSTQSRKCMRHEEKSFGKHTSYDMEEIE